MPDNASQEAASEPSREEPREGEWLSYAELGRVRGIGRESAKKLALREGWRRIPGNDGSTRVLVPREWLRPARESSRERSRESSREDTRAISALEAAFTTVLAAKDNEVAALRAVIEAKDGELAAMRGLVDGFEGRLTALETERDRALADAAYLRETMRKAEGDRAAAVVIADEAVRAAEALRQAEAARRGQGRWARLRAAWRGG